MMLNEMKTFNVTNFNGESVSLSEVEAKQLLLALAQKFPPAPLEPAYAEAAAKNEWAILALQGKKIEAIRVVRSQVGASRIGLKEARDLVQDFCKNVDGINESLRVAANTGWKNDGRAGWPSSSTNGQTTDQKAEAEKEQQKFIDFLLPIANAMNDLFDAKTSEADCNQDFGGKGACSDCKDWTNQKQVRLHEMLSNHAQLCGFLDNTNYMERFHSLDQPAAYRALTTILGCNFSDLANGWLLHDIINETVEQVGR